MYTSLQSIAESGQETILMATASQYIAKHADQVILELGTYFGPRLQVGRAAREQFSRDESAHPPVLPDAVVKVTGTDEVCRVVTACNRLQVPVVAYGTGTALEGQAIAVAGGISLDMSAMNRVLEVHQDDLDAVVQPHLTRRQLNEYLKDTGLFFSVDPGADASLGGMAATRASGTNTVRYGSMRENVLALEVVLADGRVIRTSRRARKSAAGYDLTRLFVGSEGTLGIITELTLRLFGQPEAISAAVCPFADIDGAVRTTIETIQSGIPVARIELVDDISMQAINRYSGTHYSVQPTLFLEFHGSRDSVREQAQSVQTIASEYGGKDFQWASKPEDRHRLWRARHDMAYAGKALLPKSRIWATDVCVPISRLAECITRTRQDIEQQQLLAPMVGHVGDGNFHLVLLVDHEDPEQVKKAQGLHERMVMRALALGGTCTGEHGVGLGKREFLQTEHGEALSVMRDIKQAFDPNNIMNPGKILPD